MSELIDIYDPNMRHLGVATREEVHREALWHRTFHCWVVSSRSGGSLLFQLRSAEAENYPGLYDVSAAGHLRAGEALADGIREVGEELGVAIPDGGVHFLGYRVEVVDQPNGYRDREFHAVHMARIDSPLSDYAPQISEVSGLAWLPLDATARLFSGGSERERASGLRYDTASASWHPFEADLAPQDFVPRLPHYYLAICVMAERLLEGRWPVAIF